jgi:4-hydroxythreonine-4-phosphate dehydrogenase
MKRVSRHLRLKAQIHSVGALTHATFEAGHINVIDVKTEGIQQFLPGQPQTVAARSAVTSVRRAVDLALQGEAEAIVTGPINKEAWRHVGSTWIGHTEMLQDLTKAPKTTTMFVTGPLRIFFATRHVSLRQAIDLLKKPLLFQAIVDVNLYMKQLGFPRPKLAVAGLNPHAGDSGLFGREEIDEIEPAIHEARKTGIFVDGPSAADSVFHHCRQGVYDAVLALFHDQGHIAAKTLDFHRTVSVTLGLPFIRTSVDHGTAFDIAWKGKADSTSMLEAITVAVDLFRGGRSAITARHSVS